MSPNPIDGTIDFSGGQNSGLEPHTIAKNQYYKAVNATAINGTLRPRLPYVHVPIKVVTPGSELGRSYQEIFDKGKFQGEREFLQPTNPYAISVRGGIVFKIFYESGTAQVLRTSTSDRIAGSSRRNSIAAASDYLVIADWPNQPVIIESGKARRSNMYALDGLGLIAPETPAHKIAVFLQSRLWVTNGVEFTAGDPVGNTITPKAPISFVEVYTPNAPYTGQVFTLGYGFKNQPITAMGYISSRNSQSKVQATNYGPLYVATKGSIHIYDAELPREQWIQTQFGRLELSGTGIVGQRAHSIIGSDVMFQDVYGRVHSLTKNQNDERSGWATTNISREVYHWLNTPNKEYLDVGFITYWNNRVFIGANPYRYVTRGYRGEAVYDYAHRGMVVLELDNVSSIAGVGAPSWAGVWTGINPMEATVVNDKLYIVSKDADGFNRTYVVDEQARFDEWHGTKVPIRSRIYTRAYDAEIPLTEKHEHSAEITTGTIAENFKVTLRRKPLHITSWALWNTFEFKPTCEVVCSEDGSMCPPQSAGFLSIPFAKAIETVCNKITNEPASAFREIQLLLDVVGSDWKIFKVKLKTEVKGGEHDSAYPCPVKTTTLPLADPNFESDWAIHSVCPKLEE